MKTAYHKLLVSNALNKGYLISVYDDIWTVKKSKNYNEIIEAIEAVDESEIRIRKEDGTIIGSVLIVIDFNDPVTICNYSASSVQLPFLEEILPQDCVV